MYRGTLCPRKRGIGLVARVSAIEAQPPFIFGAVGGTGGPSLGEGEAAVNVSIHVVVVLAEPRMTGQHADVSAAVSHVVVNDFPLEASVLAFGESACFQML
jgi:hypothetical protein